MLGPQDQGAPGARRLQDYLLGLALVEHQFVGEQIQVAPRLHCALEPLDAGHLQSEAVLPILVLGYFVYRHLVEANSNHIRAALVVQLHPGSYVVNLYLDVGSLPLGSQIGLVALQVPLSPVLDADSLEHIAYLVLAPADLEPDLYLLPARQETLPAVGHTVVDGIGHVIRLLIDELDLVRHGYGQGEGC